MALGGAGYFHADYWHVGYWHTNYWAEASDPAPVGAPGGGMNVAILEELLKVAIFIAFIMLGL